MPNDTGTNNHLYDVILYTECTEDFGLFMQIKLLDYLAVANS